MPLISHKYPHIIEEVHVHIYSIHENSKTSIQIDGRVQVATIDNLSLIYHFNLCN